MKSANLERTQKPLIPTIAFATLQKFMVMLRDSPKFRKSETMELDDLREEFGTTRSVAQSIRDSFKALRLVKPKGNCIVKPDFCRFLDDFDYQKKAFKKLLDDGVFSSGEEHSRKQNTFMKRINE